MPLLQTFGNATVRAWERFGPTGSPAAYELISTTVLGSDTASVTFSGLGTSAAAYKHLQIRYAARSTSISNADNIAIRFNSDSGSNYSYHALYGADTSSALSMGGSSQTYAFLPSAGVASNSSANVFGPGIIDVLDFASTTKNKTIRALAGFNGTASANYSRISLSSNVWLSTSAITSITLSNSVLLTSGSRFSLYGLR
jgi:hypothetical protein